MSDDDTKFKRDMMIRLTSDFMQNVSHKAHTLRRVHVRHNDDDMSKTINARVVYRYYTLNHNTHDGVVNTYRNYATRVQIDDDTTSLNNRMYCIL